MIPKSDDVLIHYGIKRRSGRYPWGSGEHPYQHSADFLARVEEMRKDGVTYVDKDTGKTYRGSTAIAKTLGMSLPAFRTQVSLAKAERRQMQYDKALALQEKGYGYSRIAREMGFKNESTVRNLLARGTLSKMEAAQSAADFLRDRVDERGMIDVGDGVEYSLNVSKDRLKTAFEILKMDGYEVYKGRIPQVTNPTQSTTYTILCPPGTKHSEIFNAIKENRISSVEDYISHDGGDTFHPSFVYPESLDSSRILVRYRDEGGLDRDGTVELRRGVPDISLGNSHYSQVRILVDGDKYIKGMAIYGDDKDMPDGVDVIFNTNKPVGTPLEKVLKPIERNPDGTPAENPFGSLIKGREEGGQSYYIGADGKEHLSVINKRADEGDWDKWDKKLPSQFLAKQPYELAKRQLDLAKADKNAELEELLSLTQPTVKKALLASFAEDCDAAAVDLKAAGFPRMRYQVILPIPSLKDDEVFAPNFENGEKVALVRFPHAGPFESPILTVNNKNADGLRIITNAGKDAIGVNKRIADIMSGADFDGDSPLVIPTGHNYHIRSDRPFEGLKSFDNKLEYPERKGMTYMCREEPATYVKDGKTYHYIKKIDNTQREMGIISNLITDMTINGAPSDEIEKAVRHSMVVIDAKKHKLDYKQSEKDNDIARLKNDYQHWVDQDGKEHHGGASTLLSRASAETSVLKRQGEPHVNQIGKKWYDPSKPEGAIVYKTADDVAYPERKKVKKINPETGKPLRDDQGHYIYETVTDPESGKTRFVYQETGKIKYRTQQSTQMAEVDDAMKLSSGTKIENLYADYANKMKALANQARKEMVYTEEPSPSKSAQKAYAKEVEELKHELELARRNKPRERMAQSIATSEIKVKTEADPSLENNKDMLKKLRQQALARAREKVGAERHSIKINDRQWEAIQAGALNKSTLEQILDYADMDELRKRATPHSTVKITPAKKALIDSMKADGYTNADIAKRLGVSTSVISDPEKWME